MMETSILLSGIEYKIRQLMNENIRLKENVSKLQSELNYLQQQNDVLIEKNNELTHKNDINHIAESFGNEKELEEGRRRIQSLMREIEHCITLINR
jgi:dynactin complex subunit